MPDTIFVSVSNFHNSRWPPRWPPIVYVHRNDPRTLTLCTILMNFGSFCRVSMMPNPMSMVPMTSNVNIKVIGKVVGVYITQNVCNICIRDSGSDMFGSCCDLG